MHVLACTNVVLILYKHIDMHDIIKLGRFLSRGASGVSDEGKLVSKQDFNSGGFWSILGV